MPARCLHARSGAVTSLSLAGAGQRYVHFAAGPQDTLATGKELKSTIPLPRSLTKCVILYFQGVRNVPGRIRVQIARKRNDDEDAKVIGNASGCDLA